MYNSQHWYEYGFARAPGLIRLALEWRVPLEFGAAMLAGPLLSSAAQGDGHPVLVFPGMLASDGSTGPLRRYLGRLGYTCHGWGQGNNLGPRDGVLDACRDTLHEIQRQHRRKVSLIGWSLGGIYARDGSYNEGVSYAHYTTLHLIQGTEVVGWVQGRDGLLLTVDAGRALHGGNPWPRRAHAHRPAPARMTLAPVRVT